MNCTFRPDVSSSYQPSGCFQLSALVKVIAMAALLLLILLSAPGNALAQSGLSAVTASTDAQGETTWSVSVQVLMVMTALTLLPSFILMMTSFARIVIVLALLRTALGTQQTPSSQILLGLALILTMFVMQPVFTRVYDEAVVPWSEEKITPQVALQNASVPLSEFMMNQTRESDLELFLEISGLESVASVADVPFRVLVPAFVTSELKSAFQIGFIVFIPFLIIDLVVASVLMSMGMMMLSPLIVSLPFKLMLFVLVDGWALVLGTLAKSFYV